MQTKLHALALTFLLLSSLIAQAAPDTAPAEPTARRKEPNSPFIRPRATPTTRPVEGVRRALVISIDGLRPDLMLRANCPSLRALLDRGAYSMWARTTPNSITLPSHISMMTGVNPRRHDIEWNRELKTTEPMYPRVPTLFEAAKRHGYTTAVAAGKDKFDMFDRPGVLDWKYIPAKGTVETKDVVAKADEIIRQHTPDVMLVHLPSVDTVGHKRGWSTPFQIKAIEEADAAVGKLLATLEELKLTDSTLVIVTADHGGAGYNHGPDDPRSRHIPWIAAGPGIRKGFDLTIYAKLTINTEDTFATTCWMMGIPPTVGDLDGVPVKLILQPKTGELLFPTTGPVKPAGSW
jgi:predicted AlkP superfamily pyrophosphatase or phosphodiesterase